MAKSQDEPDPERYLYPHRMPESEMITRSREALKAAGVGNHAQAYMLNWVAKEVIESTKPVFAPLHPTMISTAHMAPSTIPAWLKAYSLVLEYLEAHELELTVETFATELDASQFRTPIPPESNVSLNQLVNPVPEKLPFTERVRRARPVRKQKRLGLRQVTPQRRRATPRSGSPSTPKPESEPLETAVPESSDSDVLIERVSWPK
jgi:hypothetical protein